MSKELKLLTANDIAHDAQRRLLHRVPKLHTATIHDGPEIGADDPHHSIAHDILR